MKIEIRNFEEKDWPVVADIYRLGLLTRNATFETEAPDFNNWIKKFYPQLLWVAKRQNNVVGWAGLMPVSARYVYRGVMEVSIYIHPESNGMGIGKLMMNHLINESEKAGIWTLYASIFPENIASCKLHSSAGFRLIGYRERIAQLEGKWRNTLIYERRSQTIGI